MRVIGTDRGEMEILPQIEGRFYGPRRRDARSLRARYVSPTRILAEDAYRD